MKQMLVTMFLALSAGQAFAADEPLYVEGPVYAEPNKDANPWSRPYLGVFGGIASGQIEYSGEPDIGNLSLTAGGLEAGIRAGFDYTQGNFLVGAIADVAITNIGIKAEGGLNGIGSGTIEETLRGVATIRGRLGVTQKNNLFYAHGGAAVGSVVIEADGDEVPGINDNQRIGYVVGVGYEYAIGEHATLQTEYSYTNFGEFELAGSGGFSLADAIAYHKITSGLNMRF
ncbi:outer membrane beta-barrel protein [Devosia sp. 919]|uniref:outer membrane protein n=1 Tax=Devosia sp. 919 TaxID=2726065 RepID=UPI0015553D46|nr:outer membrane beta-barrel protein [Devosia sp. 919]